MQELLSPNSTTGISQRAVMLCDWGTVGYNRHVWQPKQLEGMCVELEAANAKGNSRQLVQIVKSMTRKFQPRLQCIKSTTGENLTKSQTGRKGIVKTCTMMKRERN